MRMDDDEFSSFWACVNLTDFPSSTDLGAYIVDHSSFGPIGGNLDSELLTIYFLQPSQQEGVFTKISAF